MRWKTREWSEQALAASGCSPLCSLSISAMEAVAALSSHAIWLEKEMDGKEKGEHGENPFTPKASMPCCVQADTAPRAIVREAEGKVATQGVACTAAAHAHLRTYSWEEVERCNSRECCLLVIHGHVYDVTSYLDEHPGAFEALLHWRRSTAG